jgi:hypothetical protein
MTRSGVVKNPLPISSVFYLSRGTTHRTKSAGVMSENWMAGPEISETRGETKILGPSYYNFFHMYKMMKKKI